MPENIGFIKNLESVHGNEASNEKWKLIQKIMRLQTKFCSFFYLYNINIIHFNYVGIL